MVSFLGKFGHFDVTCFKIIFVSLIFFYRIQDEKMKYFVFMINKHVTF